MSRCGWLALGALVLSWGAHAQGSAPGALPRVGVVTSLSDAPAARDVLGPRDLRSLLRPGEAPAYGDLIRTIRFFGQWSLFCDRLLSREGQMCWLEERSPSGAGDIVVRMELASDSRPVLVVRTPFDGGERQVSLLRAASVDSPLGVPECSGSSCVSVTLMAGAIEAAFSRLPSVDVVFTFRGGVVPSRVMLDGFADAVRSLADGQQPP